MVRSSRITDAILTEVLDDVGRLNEEINSARKEVPVLAAAIKADSAAVIKATHRTIVEVDATAMGLAKHFDTRNAELLDEIRAFRAELLKEINASDAAVVKTITTHINETSHRAWWVSAAASVTAGILGVMVGGALLMHMTVSGNTETAAPTSQAATMALPSSAKPDAKVKPYISSNRAR